MQEVKKIIAVFFLLLFSQSSFAIEDKTSFDLFSIVDNILTQDVIQQGSGTDVLIDNFQQVVYKTKKGNPLAAREDLKKISLALKNDYQRLNFAKFLYANGYFVLAQDVLAEITKHEHFKNQIIAIKEAYGVSYTLSEEQENILHKSLSLIYQENMPQEASFDLNKQSDLIKNSDYANYVMSCAFYELGQFDKSLQYIERAMKINDTNLLYKLYQAKILSARDEHKKTLQLVKKYGFKNEILKQEFLELRYVAQAKLSKNVADKMFYEGLVYYLHNDFYGAIEVLRAGLLANDKDLRLNHLLFKSLINLKEVSVAQKIADKMNIHNPKSPYTQDALGDLHFINANYISASENYKKALKLKEVEVYSKLILTNTILDENKKAKKLTEEMAKLPPSFVDENYQLAIGILNNANFKNLTLKEERDYKNAHNNLKLHYLGAALKKNPCNSFYLLELVDSIRGSEIHNLNLLELATYLGDFNFYYYWKLAEFEDFIGNDDKAIEYYKKSASLNPRFEPAVKVISNINF